MKFKLVESAKQISEDRTQPIYATYSKIDLQNILENSNDIMRITYCPNEKLWLVGKAFNYYHGAMYDIAIKNGLATYRENLGRFFYIPYSTTSNNRFELYDYLSNEFSEIFEIKVYDNFILAAGEDNSGNVDNLPGETEFFNLFEDDYIKYPNMHCINDLGA